MSYPPLPQAPACWSWGLPPLPIQNNVWIVRRWQERRCAICAIYREHDNQLDEDHDHSTGETRGFLCPRCNTSEGFSDHPVFTLYRQRYPTKMLGVLEWKGRKQHPLEEETERALYKAFSDLRLLTHDAAWAENLRDAAAMRALGLDRADPVRPEWTPLVTALHRVGLTGKEWQETRERRSAIAQAAVVCLPGESDPPRTACSGHPWTAPPRPGWMRRPCPECFRVDPVRMARMIGDGYGHWPGEAQDALRAEANRWRLNPTPVQGSGPSTVAA